MGNQEPYNGDPTFVAKSRAAWKNWLIVALVLGGLGIVLLFTPVRDDTAWQLIAVWLGTLICLICAGISALMGTSKK